MTVSDHRPLPQVPQAPDEVTPAWLSQVLRRAGLPGELGIDELGVEIIGEEFGLTGVVARLRPRYARPQAVPAGAPVSLIGKFPLAERRRASSYRTSARDQAATRAQFERAAREVRFYREIAPVSPVPAPRCYYGVDDGTRTVVLLLEDFPSARGGDVLAGCSAEDAAAVLRALAPFHARWWQPVEPPAWLPRWSRDHQTRQARYAQRVEPFLERFGDQLPPAIRALVERLRERYAAVLDALARVPSTVIHADLHLDNVLFRAGVEGEGPVVLDWQSVAVGPAAVDLAQFVAGSLAPAERRAAESGLFQRYLDRIAAGGVSGYGLAELRRDYRLALLSLLAGVVGWLGRVDLDGLVGRERALVEAALGDGRLISALLDAEIGQP